MGPAHEGSIRRPIAPWANALTTELHLATTELHLATTELHLAPSVTASALCVYPAVPEAVDCVVMGSVRQRGFKHAVRVGEQRLGWPARVPHRHSPTAHTRRQETTGTEERKKKIYIYKYNNNITTARTRRQETTGTEKKKKKKKYIYIYYNNNYYTKYNNNITTARTRCQETTGTENNIKKYIYIIIIIIILNIIISPLLIADARKRPELKQILKEKYIYIIIIIIILNIIIISPLLVPEARKRPELKIYLYIIITNIIIISPLLVPDARKRPELKNIF